MHHFCMLLIACLFIALSVSGARLPRPDRLVGLQRRQASCTYSCYSNYSSYYSSEAGTTTTGTTATPTSQAIVGSTNGGGGTLGNLDSVGPTGSNTLVAGTGSSWGNINGAACAVNTDCRSKSCVNLICAAATSTGTAIGSGVTTTTGGTSLISGTTNVLGVTGTQCNATFGANYSSQCLSGLCPYGQCTATYNASVAIAGILENYASMTATNGTCTNNTQCQSWNCNTTSSTCTGPGFLSAYGMNCSTGWSVPINNTGSSAVCSTNGTAVLNAILGIQCSQTPDPHAPYINNSIVCFNDVFTLAANATSGVGDNCTDAIGADWFQNGTVCNGGVVLCNATSACTTPFTCNATTGACQG